VLDNVYVDVTKNESYITCPRVNGLSDHDAQIIKLNNFNSQEQYKEIQIIKDFSEYIITDFKIKFSFETWDDIFEGNDVSAIFDNFLNTYLSICYSSFTKSKL
jgi:hypothetical protein